MSRKGSETKSTQNESTKKPSDKNIEDTENDEGKGDTCPPPAARFKVGTKYGCQKSITLSWANRKILEILGTGRNLGAFVNAAIQEYTSRHHMDEVPSNLISKEFRNVDEFNDFHKRLLMLLGIHSMKKEKLQTMLTILLKDKITPDKISDRKIKKLCDKYSQESEIYSSESMNAHWIIPLYMIKYHFDTTKLLGRPQEELTQHDSESE